MVGQGNVFSAVLIDLNKMVNGKAFQKRNRLRGWCCLLGPVRTSVSEEALGHPARGGG